MKHELSLLRGSFLPYSANNGIDYDNHAVEKGDTGKTSKWPRWDKGVYRFRNIEHPNVSNN